MFLANGWISIPYGTDYDVLLIDGDDPIVSGVCLNRMEFCWFDDLERNGPRNLF